jgi:hypothetical protein
MTKPLEEVRDLLLQQLEKIKKGEFSENLMNLALPMPLSRDEELGK